LKCMKTIIRKFFYKGLCFTGLILLSHILIAKDLTFSKKYEWNFDVDKNASIEFRNYDCNVVIESSSNNKVRFEMQIDVEAKEQADIDVLNSYLESMTFPARRDRVKLETMFWDNRNSDNTMGGKVIKMKLKNGNSIKLSEFKINATLQIPPTALLDLSTKYSKIELTDVQNLTLNSYDDKIYGNNVSREANIKAKYSDLEFLAFGQTRMDIYDCNFTAEKTDDLTIQSKYSDIRVNQTGNLDIEGYDDNMTFKNTGDIKINSKYSDLSADISGNLTLNVYDSNFEIEEIGNLTILESKYSEYKLNEAGTVNIATAYDDNYKIDKLISLSVNNTKYSDFIHNDLEKSFKILEGYDDNIVIHNASSSFSYLDINSKYGDIDLTIPGAMSLKIDWNTKYGKIDLDESKFTTKIKIKDNSQYEYQGIKGVESENMPFVKVRGYDVKMNLTD